MFYNGSQVYLVAILKENVLINKKVDMKNKVINKHNTKQLIRRSYSDDWVFCDTDLVPYPYDYSSDYRCPKCGGHLVNALGTCATKVYK